MGDDRCSERALRQLLEKLGMKCEGLLRGEEFARNGQMARAYYGLLCEEWSAGVDRAKSAVRHERDGNA